jgi:branched-chain amino acid transport system substrate-binding protein
MEKFLKWSAGLMVLALVLAACQPSASGSPSEAPESAPASQAAQDPAEVCAADEYGCVEIPEGEPLHIAFWGVLSGADASLGEDSRRGVELAVAEIGGTLVGHEIELTTEDGLCTPEGGAAAAQRLAADPTIVGLVGSSCSDETVGGIQAITEAGLTTISSSNTRPALTAEDRDETYAGYMRTAHSDSFQGLAVAEFAYNELGLTTAATIHDGSAYAQALQQVFADSFTELGGEIVLQDAIERGQTDMVPVLTRVAAEAPEFLYYPIFIAEGGFITSQVRGVPGLEDTVLAGSDGMFSPDFLTAAGPNAVGMYLSSPDFTAFAAEYADLVALYEETFGEAPLAVFHAHAFDAANMLFAAIEDVAMEADGTTFIPKAGLRERLFATAGFPGLTGTLTCTPTGDCGAPVIGMYELTAENVGPPVLLPTVPVWP